FLLLDWSAIAINGLTIPALTGVLMGLFNYFYLWILQEEDVSNLTGFVYFYPVVVAVLSFIFLHEVLSTLAYLGSAIILIGIVPLTVRTTKFSSEVNWWLIIIAVVVLGVWGFLVKISTLKIPELHAFVISTFAEGVILVLIL